MIKAIITLNSGKINNYLRKEVVLPPEDTIAIQRRDDETKKIEEVTIGELYELFSKRSLYSKSGDRILTEMDFNMFYEWFNAKYIQGKSIQSSIVDIKFEQT